MKQTESIGNLRVWLNIGAFLVVAIFGGFFVWLGAGDAPSDVSLEGDGCAVAGVGSCFVIMGGARSLVRDCSGEAAQELGCGNSGYELGGRDEEGQYIFLRAENPFQMLTVYRVDPDTAELSTVATHFFTPVREECENSRDRYEASCFEYPITDQQQQDIWESNNGYREALRIYGK